MAISHITAVGSSMEQAASPCTSDQPYAATSGGANSTACTVPKLPAPARPIARPLVFGENQPKPRLSATPKLAPAMPGCTPITSTPYGNLMNAPAKIGTESMKPFCAAVRLNVLTMKGTMASLSTQVAKKSKYKKAASTVGHWSDLRNV